jgi:hypothetical protein
VIAHLPSGVLAAAGRHYISTSAKVAEHMAKTSLLSPSMISSASVNNVVVDLFRCPKTLVSFSVSGELSFDSGYFQFGPDIRCFGSFSKRAQVAPNQLSDLLKQVASDGTMARLPFDPWEIAESLRRERYMKDGRVEGMLSSNVVRKAYYLIRPLLGIPVRKRMQKLFLRNWEALLFPAWPVDTTVEKLAEALLLRSMKAQGLESMPFIWFWPEGANSCAMITHDVETTAGVNFTSQLMDLDDAFGIKSSFQLIPEGPYAVSEDYLYEIRSRGFEVNIQDLRHDGNLFNDHQEFLKKVRSINGYARKYGARGFRSGRMYRNAEWYDALDFSYDMSIPNVAHLESQRGGCCTVFPYFIGDILELPLTTTEDYSLYHVLEDHSIALWRKQMDLIMERHGLVSFIVHPDYVKESKALAVYENLLQYLARMRNEENMWIALPEEVNRWWRDRSRMELVCRQGHWQIEGLGKERARIAHAWIEKDRLMYAFEGMAVPCQHSALS